MAGTCANIIQTINLGLCIAIIVFTVKIYTGTKEEKDPLQQYDDNPQTRLLLSSPNPLSLKKNVQINNYCQCGEEILNNICTEEQIIKGCYDVTPNGQKNLLRSLVDGNFCTEIENELNKQNNKFSKVFTLNYSSVNKMALGILIIYCCILGVIALLFFMLICVCVCQEKAACILLTCAPVILIVVICSGVADLVLFIIMLVNFYKGRTAGEFLDFYDECNYAYKKSLTEAADKIRTLRGQMTAFVVLNSIGIVFNYLGAFLNKKGEEGE